MAFDNGSRFSHFGSWAPFSLGHLGAGVEDHLQICCDGKISDLLSAGLNVEWHIGGCMLWVRLAHEERGVCFSGLYLSVAELVTQVRCFPPAVLPCSPRGQAAYGQLSSRDALLSALLFRPHHWHWGDRGSKSCGYYRILCRLLQILRSKLRTSVTSDMPCLLKCAFSASIVALLPRSCSQSTSIIFE